MTKKLKKLHNWLDNKGYSLKWSNTDQVDYTNQTVEICSKQSSKNQLYSLLHECGHIIVSRRRSYDKLFKAVNKANVDGRVMRSDIYKYQQLREEIEAWESGAKLAEKLDIKIDKDDYDKYAAKCFKTYIKSYAQ